MWWGDLEIWLKLFSLGCQFISFIKKLFRWIPTALCCCGWCTASLLSDINKSLLMNSDSCIELLRRKTRSVAMMYLVVISFKKTSLMCHHIHQQTKSNVDPKWWKMTIFQFSKNSFRLEQHLEPSRGEMSNCSSRTIKTKKMVIHVRLPDCNFLCCSRACRHYYFSHGKIIFWVPRTILLLCFSSTVAFPKLLFSVCSV